jgi:hypothetical protein
MSGNGPLLQSCREKVEQIKMYNKLFTFFYNNKLVM